MVVPLYLRRVRGCQSAAGGGKSEVTGGASGSLAATGVGLVGSVVGNTLIAAGGNVAGQVIKNHGFENFDLSDFVADTIIGGVSGFVGGKGMGASANIKTLNKNLTKKVLSGSKKIAASGIKYYISQTKYVYKEFLLKPILKANAAAAGSKITKNLFEVA